MSRPRFAFAGDRDIAVRVLELLAAGGHRPLLLLLPREGEASHDRELRALCPHLDESRVLRGSRFREPDGVALLREAELDFVLGVHFPYLVPDEVLALPRAGVLNLHPAYLPYNRGWHTPSWALLEGTPAGATLHFMDAGLDTGDVVHQRALEPRPDDTANSLYRRMKELELEVFREAWPSLADGSYRRTPQPAGVGTARQRRDLLTPAVQRIDPDETVRAGDLLRRLRALTTDRWSEAAYFEEGGKRYRVQVSLREEGEEDAAAPAPVPAASAEGASPPVLVWGGGGHGRVVADLVRALGGTVAGFADADRSRLGTVAEPGGARVIVCEDDLLAALAAGAPLPGGAGALVLAIGDNARRARALAAARGRLAPALVHPSAVVSPSAALGAGAVVLAGAVLNAAAVVGAAAIVNTGAVVEHDCRVGEAAHVSPHATLAGGVAVGARSWVGAGAVVRQRARVGDDATVGAGAVILRDVADGETVVGNPGRVLRAGAEKAEGEQGHH